MVTQKIFLILRDPNPWENIPMEDGNSAIDSDPVPIYYGPLTEDEYLASLGVGWREIYRPDEKVSFKKPFIGERGTPYGFRFNHLRSPPVINEVGSIWADIDNLNAQIVEFMFGKSETFHHFEMRSNIFYGGTFDKKFPKEPFDCCVSCDQAFVIGEVYTIDLHHREFGWHSRCLQKYLSGFFQRQPRTHAVKCLHCEKYLVKMCITCGADIPTREMVLDVGGFAGRHMCTHCIAVRTHCGYDMTTLDFNMLDAEIVFDSTEAPVKFDRPDLIALWPAVKAILMLKLHLYRARWYVTWLCSCPRLEILLRGIYFELFGEFL